MDVILTFNRNWRAVPVIQYVLYYPYYPLVLFLSAFSSPLPWKYTWPKPGRAHTLKPGNEACPGTSGGRFIWSVPFSTLVFQGLSHKPVLDLMTAAELECIGSGGGRLQQGNAAQDAFCSTWMTRSFSSQSCQSQGLPIQSGVLTARGSCKTSTSLLPGWKMYSAASSSFLLLCLVIVIKTVTFPPFLRRRPLRMLLECSNKGGVFVKILSRNLVWISSKKTMSFHFLFIRSSLIRDIRVEFFNKKLLTWNFLYVTSSVLSHTGSWVTVKECSNYIAFSVFVIFIECISNALISYMNKVLLTTKVGQRSA